MRCFIVLPCFNEERNLKPLIHSINEVLSPNFSYQIIAVNDGSHDRTSEILKDLSADFPVKVLEHTKNCGLGAALKTGLIAAVAEAFDDDFVITMDSDNTHDPKYVLDMLSAAEHADVVVGSRYVKGGEQLNVPLHRVILSRIVNLLIEKLFRLPLKDATSGFRCFRGSFLKRLRNVFRDDIIESNGFTASLELLLKAVALGGVIDEVSIFLDYGKKGGVSKMRLFSTVFGYLALVFRYRVLNCLKRLS
jgi:dolichol-phosphate mannosyltransferase